MHRPTIVALGDSTTAGTPGFLSPVEAPPDGAGDARSQFAWWMMQAEPGWRVLNRGVNRERTEAIAARLDRDALAARPDVLILLAGVNDVYDGDAAIDVQQRLGEMYARATRHGVPVVACSILPYDTATAEQNARMHAINAWIRDTAAAAPGLIFCDTRAAVAHADDADRLIDSPDGLHPSVEGYRRIAEALRLAVRAVLGPADPAVRRAAGSSSQDRPSQEARETDATFIEASADVGEHGGTARPPEVLMSQSFSAILPAPADRVVHSLGPSSRPAPEVRRLTLPSGLRLEYVEAGPADGLPIVLLHGLSDTHRSFDQVWPHLPTHVRVVALTLRGHGDSDRPSDGYTMPAMAADVAAAMDVLRLGPALIVGHSMGARVALRLRLDHPSRVRKLVFVNGFAPGLPNSSIDELVAAVAQLPAHLPVEFAREFQGACFAQPVDPQFVEAMVAQTLKLPTAVFRQVLDAFIADDTRAMLPRVDVPVQLIWGNRDAFVSRADQRALLEALPNASLREYADVGHTPHWECPARFAADLMDFAMR